LGIEVNVPDEGVDLDGIDIIQLLEGLLDLPLVRLDVDNEDKGVVLLNLLHRALSVERVDDDLAGIETRLMRDALARVLGCPRQSEGLGAVESRRFAHSADLVRVDLFIKQAVSDVIADTPLRSGGLGCGAYAFKGCLCGGRSLRAGLCGL